MEEYGALMAKSYLKFQTFVSFVQLSSGSLSSLLECLSNAQEFGDCRFHQGLSNLIKIRGI